MSERVYYAIEQVAISPNDDVDYQVVRGGQSMTVNQNFPTQEIFQLGKLEIYANLENLPDMEISVTKVLDGCVPAYLLASRKATTPTLLQRTAHKCKVAVSIFDNQSVENAEGTPLCTAEMTGADINNLSYTFTNDGAFQETVGFIANDIIVSNDETIVNAAALARRNAINIVGMMTGDTDPCSQVNQRQHFLFTYDSGAGLDAAGRVADPDASILPTDIEGITDSGTNEPTGNIFTADIESITISSSLTRESLNALGSLEPTCRYLNTPVEVTTEIQFRAKNRPWLSATAVGILNTGSDPCDQSAYNLTDQSIRVATCEGLRIYLGRKNRVVSNNVSGGDTSGGNMTVSRSYRTFNDFTVIHENDTADNAATWWTNRADYLTAQ